MARPRPGVGVVLAAFAIAAASGLWCVAAPAAQTAAVAQTSAVAQGVPAEGTGRITGQVVAADTGAPVKRVPVSVYGGTRQPTSTSGGLPASVALTPSGASLPPGMARRETITDEAGRFECAELPAGRYTIMARAIGVYLAPPTQHAELPDGGSATVTLRLARGGAIAGRVLDDEGEPVVRAQVSAVQRRSMGGTWRFVSTGFGAHASTDDLGQYRLFGLTPGEFYVSAAYNPAMFGPLVEDQSGEPRFGFATTFHPSATSIDGAKRVAVASGQETGGVDITLVRVKVASVSGRVVDASGASLSGRQVSVRLMPMSEVLGTSVPGASGWRADGTFVIPNVAPGSYVVLATVMTQASSSGPTTAGFENVTVGGEDATVHIQLNEGATVSGRLVIEGAVPAAVQPQSGTAGPRHASVSVRTADAGFYVPSGAGRPVEVGEDLTFTLTGLRGRVVPSAFMAGTVLKSVTFGGTEITATGLALKGTESIEGLTITLTADVGVIEGRVTANEGAPADTWVLSFPDDRSKWFPGSPFVRVTRTRPTAATARETLLAQLPGRRPGSTGIGLQAGGFSHALLPGRYLLVAMPAADAPYGDVNSPPSTDAESLEKLRSDAVTLGVAAGETATVQLTVRK